jgi:hypothetical protein
MRTLEEYLRDEMERGSNHFVIHAQRAFGQTKFYIFPSYQPGGIMDFSVKGNELVTVAEQTQIPEKAKDQMKWGRYSRDARDYVERSSLPIVE